MSGFYPKAQQLFEQGRYAEMIAYLREILAISQNLYGSFYTVTHTQEFAEMACGPIGQYIVQVWDGLPSGRLLEVNGITRWINHPIAKAA